MFTIGIVGLGFVGKAVEASYIGTLHKVIPCDPSYNSISIQDILSENPHAIFVCVPTKSNEDGSCDVSVLDLVLNELKSYKGVIISKCTAPPEFYSTKLKELENLVYSPELLRAKHAVDDYLNPEIVIFGGNEYYCREALNILTLSKVNFDYNSTIITDIITASLFKYAANAFLATKVIFANQLHDYCCKVGGNWLQLNQVLKTDKRLGNTHWDVPGPDGKVGFGGACFPKDVSAIINSASKLDVSMTLLKSVLEINDKIRG